MKRVAPTIPAVPACRICLNSDIRHRFRVNDCNLLRCIRCEFVQVDTMSSPEETKEIYSERYFDTGKYEDLISLNKENQRRFNLLSTAVSTPKARVLDFGCATGDFIRYVDHRYRIWGIDISEAAIKRAKETNDTVEERICTGSIEDLNYESNFFDAITLWDVIEHLWDPMDVCKRLLPYLRPGGHLLLSTPDIGSVTSRVMGKYWAFMTPPEHLGFFTEQSLRVLFERNLPCRIVNIQRKGKWAHIAFLFYKLKRIFPNFVPPGLIHVFRKDFAVHWSIYVPTADIQYVIIQKSD